MTSKSFLENESLEYILNMLPGRILRAVQGFRNSCICGSVEEIRLRRDKCVSITSEGRNYILNNTCNAEELEQILSLFCHGSLYAHSETIKNGYIVLRNGIRIGVCGRASYNEGRMVGVSDISSLCIRIPHKIECDVSPVLGVINRTAGKGVLIYSQPGEGKTTLLRNLSRSLAMGNRPLRVVIVDTRGELGYSLDEKNLCIDILSGYTKAEGISIAARTMSAEIIICDEIGGYDEAESIVMAHNCGIPLVASAHASSLTELMNKPSIKYMQRAGIFSCYIGIKRKKGEGEYEFNITMDEAI